MRARSGTQTLLRSPRYQAHSYAMLCHIIFHIIRFRIIWFYFYEITWQMKKHERKRSLNTVSSSVLKKEENLRLTIYKIEMHDEVPNIVILVSVKLF